MTIGAVKVFIDATQENKIDKLGCFKGIQSYIKMYLEIAREFVINMFYVPAYIILKRKSGFNPFFDNFLRYFSLKTKVSLFLLAIHLKMIILCSAYN